jgi:hypothetical protein
MCRQESMFARSHTLPLANASPLCLAAAGPRAVVLSTSPKADRTHWQQTILCLPEDVDMQRGEVLRGEVRCFKNPLQQRWLDISVKYAFRGQRGKRSADQCYFLH